MEFLGALATETERVINLEWTLRFLHFFPNMDGWPYFYYYNFFKN